MIPVSPSEETLFLEALHLTAAERPAFLESRCGGDGSRVAAVLALLRGYEENSDYLERPAGSSPGNSTEGVARVAPDHVVGDRIGPYHLREQLGAGGCGLVYLAEQREPVRREVALKVIKLGLDTREFIARFEAERQALALMHHPNIARIYDAGATPAGRPYLAMELIRGQPITRHCDEHRLALSARLELFIAVCEAVQHAHQKGIIHRDLKPSNLLVSTDEMPPTPKVIDFGIAKALHGPLTDKTLFTQAQAFVGTPAYTSPEQSERGNADVDTRTDVYSLGVVLYELLTGQPTFDRQRLERASLEETRRLIREEQPRQPSARLQALDPTKQREIAARRSTDIGSLLQELRTDLDWIVMRCLEKDRSRRYATASALAADIRRHLDGEAVVARPPSRVYQLSKFVARHRTVVFAAGACAFAVVAGLIATGFLLVRERAARERAVAAERAEAWLRRQAEQARQEQAGQAARALIDLANERLAQGRTSDGLAYLVSAARQDPGNTTIAPRLASLLTSRSFLLPDRVVAEHPSAVLTGAFSRDGARFVAVWEDGTLARVDLRTFAVEQERLSTTVRATFGQMATPNFLLVYGTDNLIYAIDRETGRVSHRIGFDHDPMGCRAVDGSSDLFITKLTSNEMLIADARSGEQVGRPIPYEAFLGIGPHWAAWSEPATDPMLRSVRLRRTDSSRADVLLAEPAAVTQGGLAASPAGDRVATVERAGPGDQYHLRLWAMPGGHRIGEPQTLNRKAHPFFSPDGKLLLCWGEGLEVFNAATGARTAHMPSAGDFTSDTLYSFSPDGRTLATWGNPGLVDLWDFGAGSARIPALRHGSNVVQVSFSRDGRTLMTTSDTDARVWNLTSGALIAEPTIRLHGRSVIALSPEGTQLVVATEGGALRRFQIGSAQLEPLSLAAVRGLPSRFMPGQPVRVLQLEDTRARVVDVASGTEVAGGFSYPEPIRAATLRDDARVGVVQTTAGEWQAWWRGEGGIDRVVRIPAELKGPAHVIFSRANDEFALANGTSLRAWNLRTGEPAGPAIATTQSLTWARFTRFSPDGRHLLMGSNQGQARVWEVSTGRVVVDFVQQPTAILRAMYSPDGRLVATGARRALTQLFEASSGREIGSPVRHRGEYTEGVFSPDGQVVASYSADGTVYVQQARAAWAVTHGIETAGSVWMVNFSHDGKRLVTTTREGTAQIFDVASGVPLGDPLRHGASRVIAAHFSEDDRYLLTETAEPSGFHVWPLPPAAQGTPDWLQALALICSDKGELGLAPRSTTPAGGVDEIRRHLGTQPDASPYDEWGRWFLTEPAQRSIAPRFTLQPRRPR